jgi:hypothetical protein
MAAERSKSDRSDPFTTALRAVRLLILLAIVGWFVSWIEFAVASEAPVPREPETGFREAATGLPEPERPLFPPEVV